MEWTALQIHDFILGYLLPFCRIASFFMAIPAIGTKSVPRHIRAGLSVLISLLIGSALPSLPIIDVFTLKGLLCVLQQIVIGIAMGFVFTFITQIIIFAGQILAMQAGLGFAQMMDPHSGSTVPLLSQYYLLFITVLFLLLNGHLVMIQELSESFQVIPLTGWVLTPSHCWKFVEYGVFMFQSAILISLPGVIALLLVNLSMGIMGRAAPQLNIFAVGFPITLMFGFIMIYFTLGVVAGQMETYFETGYQMIHQWTMMR